MLGLCNKLLKDTVYPGSLVLVHYRAQCGVRGTIQTSILPALIHAPAWTSITVLLARVQDFIQ